MPIFDIDFTLSITHTESFEAESLYDAQRIADALYDTSWFSDIVEEVTTDYEAFDSDHCATFLSRSVYGYVTLDNGRLNEYLNENTNKED